MPEKKTGVVPCYEGMIKVGATKEAATTVKDMVGIEFSFDNGVEEWYPYDGEGWVSRLPTAKAVTLSISGKRCIGDTGNDYVAGLAFKNGQDAMGYFAIVFPDGTEISWDKAAYNVTALNGGDSTTAAPLEFDVMSSGKPTLTPAAA